MTLAKAKHLIMIRNMEHAEVLFWVAPILLIVSAPGVIAMLGCWLVALPCCTIEDLQPHQALMHSKQLSKGHCCSLPALTGATLFIANLSLLFLFSALAVMEGREEQKSIFPDFIVCAALCQSLVGAVFHPAMALLCTVAFLCWHLENEGKGVAALRQGASAKDEGRSEQK